MGDHGVLGDLLVLAAASVVAVWALRRIGVPTIAGFIVAGAVVGPRGLGLVKSAERVETLAEVGVVLLLFGIGVELSLERLRRLWRPVLLGGTAQMGLTIAATFVVARLFGLAEGPALFLGFLVAPSSTAIVLRGLEARGEVDAPHGRITLGILVFQDLCVVPMMLLLPALAGQGGSGGEVLGVVAGVLLLLFLLLVAAQLVVPRVLALVARTRQRDLFVLAVFVACLGTAWVFASVGVSLALGAFLAGLAVAGSEFRHQAVSDLIPMREVLTSVFFMSVGMLLDPAVLARSPVPVLLLLLAIVVGKFVLVFATGVVLRLPLRITVLSAAALLQMGEFSFVLAHAARAYGLVAEPLAGSLFTAATLSMLLSPLGLAFGPHLAAGASRLGPITRLLDVRPARSADEGEEKVRDHVIIAGYGVTGEELARSLRKCGAPYLVLDLNPANVRAAEADGHPSYFGDVTSAEVLEYAGASRARALVVVINHAEAAERAVAAARARAPGLHVVARARYLADRDRLARAGANEVIVAEMEAAAEVVARTLELQGVPEPELRRHLDRVRAREVDR